MSDRLTASRDTAALLARFREQRCPEAFRALVENYSGLVRGVAERILEESESARDVTQAVFADLVRLAPALPENTALGGWLHRHSVFLALRQRTANRRRGLREAEAQRRWNLDAPPDEPPPWRAELDDALNHLPASDRHALSLRFFENQPLRSVAAVLDIGEDAAQKRISRALDKLRGLLARRGFSSVSAAALTASLTTLSPPASASAAAALSTAALQTASASAIPAAGAWTTFFVMNVKPIIAGAAAAALLTGSILTPVILSQRNTIADLEQKLRTAPSAALAKIAAPSPAGPKTAAASVSAKRADPARSEYETIQARLLPVEDQIKAWAAAVMQIDDAERKKKALAEMLAAMLSLDDQRIFAAITAYQRVGNVEFDRAPFRPAIVRLLTSGDPLLRRSALGLVPGLPPDESDIARITAMAADSDAGVRKTVLSSLFWLTKGDLTGDAGRTVLSVLNNAEVPARSLIDVMWGAKFTPELEKKLVEFARAPSREGDEQLAYYAVYSCLSTQNNKGPDCVDLLIERLSDPDSYNVGGRAAWGLAYGVQPNLGLETKIAGAALKVWRNRTDTYLREQLMKCIKQYGDATHATVLDEIAAAPAMGETQRQQLTEVAAALRERSPNTTH